MQLAALQAENYTGVWQCFFVFVFFFSPHNAEHVTSDSQRRGNNELRGLDRGRDLRDPHLHGHSSLVASYPPLVTQVCKLLEVHL